MPANDSRSWRKRCGTASFDIFFFKQIGKDWDFLLREKKNLVVQSVVLVVGLAEMVWCALAAAVWGAVGSKICGFRSEQQQSPP